MIQEALSLPIPQYAHITLTLAPDKTKLSKRHGATAIKEYREMGYLPEAMINFMAFLGWNPGTEKEFFSLDELTKEFSIEKMQKSASIFNIEKLNWFNAHYIKNMPLEKLTKLCLPFLEKDNLIEKISNSDNSTGITKSEADGSKFKILNSNEEVDFAWLQKIVKLGQERMRKLSEIGELTQFFFKEPDYNIELLNWKKMEKDEIKASLDKSYNILFELEEENFEENKLKEMLMPEAEKIGDRGALLWPLRAALTGLKASPPPFEVLAVLGKEKALKRLKTAIGRL
jgi:glutamyl/glutaminyl-tRNA synthetase